MEFIVDGDGDLLVVVKWVKVGDMVYCVLGLGDYGIWDYKFVCFVNEKFCCGIGVFY